MHSHPSNPFQTSHSRWRAITLRDAAAHCSFLYGVTSTKIYCRPTCAARVARRANVVFYDTADQARCAGFRACCRCKPDDAGFIGQRELVVQRVLSLLRVKGGETAVKRGVKELAGEVGVTPSWLCRVFKKTMGVTLGEYIRQFEMEGSEGEREGSIRSAGMVGSAVAGGSLVPVSTAWSSESHAQWTSTVASGVTDVGTRLPTPLTTASTPLAPSESWPAAFADPPSQPSIGVEGRPAAFPAFEPFHLSVGVVEETVDLDFDFGEWLWTEGFDLNDWPLPTAEFANDGLYG
ncbi:hypothetical protein LTR08_002515 [Meristemomyces frigidus]|nr:hypothetical protein LTR08_002515 [Meristemomyces frigidus]